jgi:hypothetical protein
LLTSRLVVHFEGFGFRPVDKIRDELGGVQRESAEVRDPGSSTPNILQLEGVEFRLDLTILVSAYKTLEISYQPSL